MFLPYYGMIMRRSENPSNGLSFFSEECLCSTMPSRSQKCDACSRKKRKFTTALKEGKADEEFELWEIHRDHINQVWKNGGKSRHKKAPVHPTLLNWAIALLVRDLLAGDDEILWVEIHGFTMCLILCVQYGRCLIL